MNLTTCVVMNPPYSLKYSAGEHLKVDPRFALFGLAPKSKADYMFVLDGLDKLSDDGTMAVVLPHGVLFRSGAEADIRTQLIKRNHLDGIIGLPPKLFSGTDIPTVVMVLKKKRERKDVFVISADREFRKDKNKNRLDEEHINKILDTYSRRANVERYASVVMLDEIEQNDFNLNIPRYVDTFEKDPPVDMVRLAEEIREIDQEIYSTQAALYEMTQQLVATDPLVARELEAFQRIFEPFEFDGRKASVPFESFDNPESVKRIDPETNLPSKEYQQMTIDMMVGVEERIKQEEKIIEQHNESKKWALDKMFC